MSPSDSRSSRRRASSIVRPGAWSISTGWGRPAISSTGQSPRAAEIALASIVADMTTSRRSSRASIACRASANARSACRLRSWNSSSRMVANPCSSGSRTSLLVRTPSVATRSRVAFVKFRSKRTCQPTCRPAVQPRSWAMRLARERAARRRGWSRIAGPASRSAGATRVVLPAPGSATSTRRR